MSTPYLPDQPITIEDFEAIETDIRTRLDELDQRYKQDRQVLENKLASFQAMKRSMLEFVRKYRNGHTESFPGHSEAKHAAANDGKEMPWGRYAAGADKVFYVVKEAGKRGLARLEVVDRIAEISGQTPELNSVTAWLYRLKKRGQVRNMLKRWYANA